MTDLTIIHAVITRHDDVIIKVGMNALFEHMFPADIVLLSDS